jgi:hypothetical protein
LAIVSIDASSPFARHGLLAGGRGTLPSDLASNLASVFATNWSCRMVWRITHFIFAIDGAIRNINAMSDTPQIARFLRAFEPTAAEACGPGDRRGDSRNLAK